MSLRVKRSNPTQLPNKIYWYGFTRQLKELYYLLTYEKFISCGWDEFFTHFTGKKFTITLNPKSKLKWEGEKDLLVLIVNHLVEKRFLDSEAMTEHFKFYQKNKTKSSAKKLQVRLGALFPATSGYRCKERLFYRVRNKDPESVVFKNCGIVSLRA